MGEESACLIREIENGLLVTFDGEPGTYCRNLKEVQRFLKLRFPLYITEEDLPKLRQE